MKIRTVDNPYEVHGEQMYMDGWPISTCHSVGDGGDLRVVGLEQSQVFGLMFQSHIHSCTELGLHHKGQDGVERMRGNLSRTTQLAPL